NTNVSLCFNYILVVIIIDTQALDFDTIIKIKNNSTYIRNHRGITHSIPAIIIWCILIPLIIYLFVPEVNFLHLWLWTFLAVFLPVLVDVFNAYGTQAFIPFSCKLFAYCLIITLYTFLFFVMYSILTAPQLLDLFLINASLLGLLIRSIRISFLHILRVLSHRH